MNKRIIVNSLVLLVLVLLVGCATPLDRMRAQNRQRLLMLSPGMSKSEVISIMGTESVSQITNPYRTELYKAKNSIFEILLYYTDQKKVSIHITDDELTPIIIRDGKVDGWGWLYWNNLVEKFELRIR